MQQFNQPVSPEADQGLTEPESPSSAQGQPRGGQYSAVAPRHRLSCAEALSLAQNPSSQMTG